MITLGSQFSGSGGFELAGMLNGIMPVWASEIEPYAIAVTASRFPQIKHLGDVRDIDGTRIDPVDVITFGSPCTDVSIAGKLAGQSQGRDSSLFFEAIRIIREMRCATNGRYPRFAVFENVPGLFSSAGGEDFRTALQAFVGVCNDSVLVPEPPKGRWLRAGEIVGDHFSVAWRVQGAEYWGVPQRRNRIYLVADFAGQRAGKVLFEQESLRGHTVPRAAAGQAAAAAAQGGAGGSAERLNGAALVCNESGIGYWMPGFGCLRAEGENRPSRPGHIICFQQNNSIASPIAGDLESRDTDGGSMIAYSGEKAGTLDASYYKGPGARSGTEREFVAEKKGRKYIVRRLTPTECARLQGFPDCWAHPAEKDNFTDEEAAFWEGVREAHAKVAGGSYRPYARREQQVKWYNRLHKDSAEYKLYGNGIALPCAVFVQRGIAMELSGEGSIE